MSPGQAGAVPSDQGAVTPTGSGGLTASGADSSTSTRGIRIRVHPRRPVGSSWRLDCNTGPRSAHGQ